jgi:hypothetical protein
MMRNLGHQNRFRLILGVSLISLGVLLVLDQIFAIGISKVLWPFYIIIPGVAFFIATFTGGTERGGLAIPASILTTLGVLLLYQAITNHWESWAYAWALIFPTSVGAGIVLYDTRTMSHALQKTGMGLIKVGLVIFLSAGIFFEMFLYISESPTHRITWSIIMVLAGVYLTLQKAGWIRLPDRLSDLVAPDTSDEVVSTEPLEGIVDDSPEQIEPSEEV